MLPYYLRPELELNAPLKPDKDLPKFLSSFETLLESICRLEDSEDLGTLVF